MNTIYKSMSAIMADMSAIGKNQKNVQQGFMYRGIDQVYNELHPIMAKHKVFCAPEVIDRSREERTNAKGTVLAFVTLVVKYTFWAEDGSSVSCTVAGEGMDSGDKATNKAMAVAHKYAMLQTFCIPTEDMVDPDSEAHTVAAPPKTRPAAPAPPPPRAVHASPRSIAPALVTMTQIQELMKALKVAGIEESAMLARANITQLRELEAAKFKGALSWIKSQALGEQQ